MKKWDHKILCFGTAPAIKETPRAEVSSVAAFAEKELKRYGEEGWQVVSFTLPNPGIIVLLKREIPEPVSADNPPRGWRAATQTQPAKPAPYSGDPDDPGHIAD